MVKTTSLNKIQRRGLKYKITCSFLLQKDRDRIVKKKGVFGTYPTYSEIDSILKGFESQYPKIFKLNTLSKKSYQGKDIYLIKISNNPNQNNNKPEMLILGAQHGDEGIGSKMCLSDMEYLCKNYNKDQEITWLVNNRQIYFIPVQNPDRYVWNERFSDPSLRKRKNMNIPSGYSALEGGVDLNRNFPYKWGIDNHGSSSNPGKHNYRGTKPFSEPECQALINFINTHKIRTWQNHHNGGNFLIIPFGYKGTSQYPPNKNIYFRMCEEQKRFYNYVKYGNSADCYDNFVVNGGAEDWGWYSDNKTYQIYCIITQIGETYWDYYNDPIKLKKRCNSLIKADLYMIKCAGFYPIIKNIIIKDNSPEGNNDGKFNPGETVKLYFVIENKSVVDTTQYVKGYLSSNNSSIIIKDSLTKYGNVIPCKIFQNSSDPFLFQYNKKTNKESSVKFILTISWTMNYVNFEKHLHCSLKVKKSVTPNKQTTHKRTTPPNSSNFTKGNFGFSIINNPLKKSLNFKIILHSQDLISRIDNKVDIMIFDSSGIMIKRIFKILNNEINNVKWNRVTNSGYKISNDENPEWFH